MKYVIYARKSTEGEDRQVLSLDAQERELLDLAKKNGLDIVATFRESMSAKSAGRPVFEDVMKYLASGKADAILCWKLDRLARNFVDAGRIIDLLQTSKIKEIQTYEGKHLPTDNVLMIAVQMGMANQYIRDLSVNVKRGNREKLLQGGWPGKAPFGYINDQVSKKVIPYEKESHYVKRAYDLYINHNKSFGEISDILYTEGLRTKGGNRVFKGSVQRFLSTKFYMGIMERDGKVYLGNHEPIISKTDFDQAQMMAESRTRPRPQNLFFPLRGFLSCESCGCALTASLKKGHQYYYCTNGKKRCEEHKSYLREITLYGMVAEILGNLAFSERQVELAYRAAKERTEGENSYNTQVLEKLTEQLSTFAKKESKLLDTFLNDQITKEVYDAKLQELKNERVLVEAEKKQQVARQPSTTLEPVKKIFMNGITRRKEFIDANDEGKREIVESVLWNLTLKDKKIVTKQYKSEYMLLANSPKNLTISQLLGYKDSNLDTQDQNLMSYH